MGQLHSTCTAPPGPEGGRPLLILLLLAGRRALQRRPDLTHVHVRAAVVRVGNSALLHRVVRIPPRCSGTSCI
jgi:hypothetical protein